MEYEIITRSKAIQLGLKFYFTGKPCKHGHLSKRHVSSGCYACLLTIQKAYRERHPEKHKAKNARWNNENREKKLDTDRIYREKNAAQRRSLRKKYKAERRQASVISTGELDALVLEEAYSLSKLRSIETGILWHVDHIFPLNGDTVCGLHCADNIQVIPAAMNLSKGNRLILTERHEWLRANL